MKSDEYNPGKDTTPKSPEDDFSLRAVFGRHPCIVFVGKVLAVMIVAWPFVDYFWYHLVLGFK